MSISRLKNLWADSVIKDNLKEVLKLYSSNATFKGTFMNNPVKGKEGIKKYFIDFTPTVDNIKFQPNHVSIKNQNIVNEIGNYKFYTKKGIIDAQYNFVFLVKDKEAKILSHFSTLHIK